jgi:exodeoxyribonuclease VII small subunit
MSETAKTYQENYQTLEKIVHELSNNQNVDIDKLLPMVDEASKAYQFCKSRIDEIEVALNQRFEQQGQSAQQVVQNNNEINL